jgi:hypothetical protein
VRLELIGGSYATRSVLGSAERCVNLFPEPSRANPRKQTHYPTAGLKGLIVPPVPAAGRGIFRASNNNGYCVIGINVYAITPNNKLQLLGALNENSSYMCSMRDNGLQAFLVDNSNTGYTWNIQTNSDFGPIVDPTGTFIGATKVDFLDGYLLWNFPLTNEYGCTTQGAIGFNPTLIGVKDGYPDFINSFVVNQREIILLGNTRGEIHYNAGNPLFPFAILPGAYIEFGCVAPYSVAFIDKGVFWLGQSELGAGLVLRQSGYQTTIVSNYALSYALQQMTQISDAVGFVFMRDGHMFYGLTFPAGNQTWVLDVTLNDPSTGWHQEAFLDPNGNLNRSRVVAMAWVNGVNMGQDWANGTLYNVSPDYYASDVDLGDGNGPIARPIPRIRTFPQVEAVGGGFGGSGQGAALADGKGIKLNRFVADFQCGDGALGPNNEPPQLALRMSVDRGRTFGQNILQSTGQTTNEGNVVEASYRIAPQWQNLGVGRWPVFELSWSFAGAAALNGAWLDAEIMKV